MVQGTAWVAVVRRMYEQELQLLREFEPLMVERRARPSLLHPVWHVAGFALGAATPLLGPKAAMACTVAVEEDIDEHYRRQGEAPPESEGELKETIQSFRREGRAHPGTGIPHGAEEAVAAPPLSG